MWFKIGGIEARWWQGSPRDKWARCDVGGEDVAPHQWRLMVDNGLGPQRARAHGKRNQWMCEAHGDQWIDEQSKKPGTSQ